MAEAFEDHGSVKDVKRMTSTGLVTKECFDHLASSDDSQLSNKEIRGFLISFGLATPVQGQDCLYVPSLIRDINKKKVMDRLKQIKKDDTSLGFLFQSKISDGFHNVYSRLICKLLQGSSIFLHKGFAEKVENRRIGNISGMWGSLKSSTPDATGSQEFVILETDRNSMRPEDQRFARDKVVQLSLFWNYLLSVLGDLHLFEARGLQREEPTVPINQVF